MKSNNKKERRKARHERNLAKDKLHKEEAWKDGKLIEPNHNNGPYPPEYCVELGNRLAEYVKSYHANSGGNNDLLIQWFRLYKRKLVDFILHFNPDIPKTDEYEYLKFALETYWDEPENLYKNLNNYGK